MNIACHLCVKSNMQDLYCVHMQDCTVFKSEKTGRGPLQEGWKVKIIM